MSTETQALAIKYVGPIVAANHLLAAKSALNASGHPFDLESPTTPYSATKKALLRVLEEVAVREGASSIWAKRWAEAVHESALDTHAISLAIEAVGGPDEFARAASATEAELNEAWGV